MNSALVTGVGAVRFTAPDVSAVRRWVIAATSSSIEIQLCHWSPLPILPPRPNLNSGSCFLSAPPFARQHDARAEVHDAGAGGFGHARGLFPLHADVGEEPCRRALDCLVEFLVAARAVDADRRAGQQHRGPVLGGRRSASEISVVPFVRLSSSSRLYVVGPALVADAGAGEVDDGIDAVECVGVDPALRG